MAKKEESQLEREGEGEREEKTNVGNRVVSERRAKESQRL